MLWPSCSLATMLDSSSILKLYGMEMNPESHTCQGEGGEQDSIQVEFVGLSIDGTANLH